MKRALGLIAALGVSTSAAAQSCPSDLRHHIPSTVSIEAAREMESLFSHLASPPPATPRTLADWDRQAARMEAAIGPLQQQVAQSLHVTTQDDTLGGVPVLRIFPANFRPSGRILVYVHGGAYVFFSARSSIATPALLAAEIGDQVISIDYTVAPRGNWRTVTDQVLAAWRALLASGVKPSTIGLFGDSAGGGLAAGAVLKMRDQGLPLPGALYLGSPWSDITDAGDTYMTLEHADPLLSLEGLRASAAAYAAPADQKNPYVSPIYGDYSKAFPPTLIQGGTREIFLSNFVRQYQAIRGGGHEAVLDLYEGMPHVFQAVLNGTPEARTAVQREAAFFKEKLKP